MKKLNILFVAILFLQVTLTYSQPAIVNSFSQIPLYFHSIINTHDQGFIISGDNGIMKVDSNGHFVWGKTNNDYYYSTANAHDSCYLIAGGFDNASFIGERCLKINNFGDTLWTCTIADSGRFISSSIIESSDSSIIISGIVNRQICLIKISPNGHLVWKRNFLIGNFRNVSFGCIEGNDMNYYMYGGCEYHDSTFYDRPVILKIDSSGNLIWAKSYMPNINVVDLCIPLNSGLLCLVSHHGIGVFMKIDTSGNLLWSDRANIYSQSWFDLPHSIYHRKNDNDYLIVSDAQHIFEIDSDATSLNDFFYTERVPIEDFALRGNSDFAIIANGFDGPGIVSYDNVNQNCFSIDFNYQLTADTILSDTISVTIDSAGQQIFTPVSLTSFIASEFMICPYAEGIFELPANDGIQIYPNPTRGRIEIDFKNGLLPSAITIYDMTGKVLYVLKSDQIVESVPVELNLYRGVYILKFIYKNKVVSKKLVCFE